MIVIFTWNENDLYTLHARNLINVSGQSVVPKIWPVLLAEKNNRSKFSSCHTPTQYHCTFYLNWKTSIQKDYLKFICQTPTHNYVFIVQMKNTNALMFNSLYSHSISFLQLHSTYGFYWFKFKTSVENFLHAIFHRKTLSKLKCLNLIYLHYWIIFVFSYQKYEYSWLI